jgi:hypothetical protein
MQKSTLHETVSYGALWVYPVKVYPEKGGQKDYCPFSFGKGTSLVRELEGGG